MKINLRDVKTCILGIQGSGKTECAKKLVNQFKKPFWYLMHLDDMKGLPKKTSIILAQDMSLKELDDICRQIIIKGKKGECDAIVIDEADMFLSKNLSSTNAKHINDLVINHRHYGIAVIFITRRPADIPTKIYESCEHCFIFALPNSDNIEKKMASLHRDIPELSRKCNKDNHHFIHIRLGYPPKLCGAIKLKTGGKK